jgi:serine/threonine protein kinase/TPR repeat protein/chaperone required for assembly of F1-ATPase
MATADRYQQYEVLRREDGSLWELGRGAMGITYKAYDTNLRFAVALKVINAAYLESDTARQRFLREARAAAALRHPNVASVFNLGMDRENYFYVMEFIDGETLEAAVRRKGPLTPLDALDIALQVARALAVAAKQQLVHRDLKPTNLMLVDQEGELTVKVIDFGLAKVAKDAGEDSAALTMGGFVGTPHFASPEQVEEGEVDIRSDFYSLGATLYYVLTGQSPFSGSIGQIMSQHLYKPLPMQPLTNLPRCVASLVQRMMEKDRNARPQNPQELQKAILACLDEIRGSPGSNVQTNAATANAPETLDLSFSSGQPLGTGVTLAQTYKLVEELVESPHGREFLADDLRHNRRVNIVVLSPEFLADKTSLSALREAVRLLRQAPHPMLREVYSLETFSDCSFLVEEYVAGTPLLDLLRRRGVLTAPEVARLLNLLAPVADHAARGSLQHLDLALSGIHLLERASSRSGIHSDILRRPLTAWEALNAKVDAINFAFAPAHTGTWGGMATRIQGPANEGPRGSYVRLLSLLAYELLGGPRARLDATGQYTPVATLTREGNAVLRRGLIDEFPSAAELSRQLAATVGAAPALSLPSDSKAPAAPESLPRTPPPPTSHGPPPQPSTPAGGPIKRKPKLPAWLLFLALGAIALAGIAIYLLESSGPVQEIPALSVETEPSGASILLDGKRPQVPPNKFTHVPFGPHQLSATLENYEPMKQDIQVRNGTSPEVHLQLRPIQEIPALSVQTDPSGASILLDGRPPQVPPNTFTHVPLGSHQLSATLDNYEPIKQDIQVRKGMSSEIHLQLKPVQEIPALSVLTEPTGASILLDGKPPQVPPNTFTHVPLGSHQLSATLDNYEPIKQDIQVRRGMSSELRLQFKPIQEIPALSVQTEPPGAAILLDGKPPQVPPNTFIHVPFGPHQLSAALDNYEPFKQEIQIRKGMNPEIQLQLREIQEIAALSVQTEPPGASVLLDGKPPQMPPNTFTHVPYGPHQVTATLENYEAIRQDIQVRRGMSPEIQLPLRPIQEVPSLSVLTEPSGASVLLDGKPPQIPPNTFTHVPFGSHQLSVTLDNYEPIKQDIQVRRGMSPEVQLTLRPIQEIPALSILTEPSGASVLLDGKPPQMPPNTFIHVPFGSHQVSATLENYEPIKQDVQVRRGMSSEIHLQLKPITEIPALSVQTEPPGALILLDGKPPQIPPDRFTHVPFGPHQLSANLDKYEPITQDIQVTAGMQPEIRLQLKLRQEPRNATFQRLLADAQLGDPIAMMKVGRLYLKRGTPDDDVEGFNWLNRAYNAPNRNLEAGAYVADCYLSGRGTKPDVQKAEEIITPLANQNVVPAMTLAGRILQYKAEIIHSQAAASANRQMQKRLEAQANELDRQARQWWERAAKKDDWNAAAHLGKCYEDGWGGVEKDEEQAEKLYQEGVEHGNPLSLLLYGLMIQDKPGRRNEAAGLISRAAAAGLPSAIKWCKENNVTFSDKPPNDDQQ